MWIVAKIKSSELNIFKNELRKKFNDDVKFYSPKIQLKKIIKNKIKEYNKSLLENYIFCFHEGFKNIKNTQELKFIKGLNFFLDGYELNQKQISAFINYCKNYEDSSGFIKSSFFKKIISNKAKFVSGPFTNMFFHIIEKQKNKLKIIVGNIVTIVPDNKNYLYQQA